MSMQATPNNATLVSFDKWLSEIGLTRTTGYRYRQKGILSTINIFGRLYISRETIAEFEEKAKRGDFARDAKTPARREAAEVG